jgi:penicillin amidase
MVSRKEIISVKGNEDVEYVVRSTRHGPIINEVSPAIDSIETQPVSFFWTFNKFPFKVLQSAYDMAHSKNINDFSSAISRLEAPGVNITYADKDGNIAWWAVARLIERPEHVEPKMILDGSSGKDDPIGYYPFSANPHSVNPTEGFVYSANNQPDSANGILHPGYYYPGLRGRRIIDLLSAHDQWDVEAFQEMIMDDTSPFFPEIAQQVVNALSSDLSQQELQVADILSNWDGSHAMSEIAPSIYYRLINQVQKNAMADELGEANFNVYTTTLIARRSIFNLIKNDSAVWWDNIYTSELESREWVMNTSFKEVVGELSQAFGPDPNLWTWDRIHLVEHAHAIGRQKPFNHLFNVGPFPVAGGDEVLNKMDFNKNTIPYQVKSGPSMRIIIDLADMHNSLSIIPTGQSGHVMSPYYQDQAALYHSGGFRPQLMDKQKVLKNGHNVLVLKPVTVQ